MTQNRARTRPEHPAERAPEAVVETPWRPLPPANHLSPGERKAHGKAARAVAPRSVHAAWSVAPDRPDPVAILEAQASTRVPELVPIRYGRMLTSPFAFFRGGAAIMAADLAALPRTRLLTQLCGDAHISNFGLFAAPDRGLVFGLNDFDETLPGPFEWDVKRLAASIAVAGRDNGFTTRQRRATVLVAVREYREAMQRFAPLPALSLWYLRLDVSQVAAHWMKRAGSKTVLDFDRTVAKARAKDNLRAFSKLTHLVDGEPRIVSDPPLIVPIEELLPEAAERLLSEAMQVVLRSYRRTLPRDRRRLLERYRYVHAARKVVGVGSVGTRVWILLLLGTDHHDPLFLQLKEAEASVLEPFLVRSPYANHGLRVVAGQHLMQAASDILLGWERLGWTDGRTHDFYVRQLWDAKGSVPVETMDPTELETYARLCGWTLARAHARAGDAIAISSYLGSATAFDESIAAFAEAYADQNERDYQALWDAVASGRVIAELGL